ncbi:uncharacterized protein LOC132630462 [Lycium barbarum]|uniref:uncharacterized protein LOC132630462 n=1 Tax=Lycium barbarum TaxID=112863 RepID=UPI00293E5B49|nr:uncharacterized protein LOC132630462 [Lycium barbarum]
MVVTDKDEQAVDSSIPMYMHPYDNAGALLVPSIFNGIAYRSWRRGVLRSLLVKNKLGFINDDCKKPDSNFPRYRLWERCDNMNELEDQYDQTNGTRLYQIQREINDLSQGNMDITGYYTRMKQLWEELNNLNAKTQCSCNCTCGANENMHKVEQDRKLVQFLMGLNEVYTIVR